MKLQARSQSWRQVYGQCGVALRRTGEGIRGNLDGTGPSSGRQAPENIGGPDSMWVGADVPAARRDTAVGGREDDGRFS